MDKLKFLIFTLTFCELPVDLDAKPCGKGHFLTMKRECHICPEGQYQPKENTFSCKACTTCETDRGSDMVQSCTKETDTKCQCREGFVPWGDDTATCKCEPGFGLRDKKCSKCENGYFNSIRNQPCRKWKECKYGVEISGTTTSDVVCKSNPDITTPSTACSTPDCRQEHIQTQNRDPTTITTTTISTPTTITATAAYPGHTLTTKRELKPPTPSNTGNYTGLVLLLFGIGALIILTAVTCKLHITPCVRNPSVPSKDSMCRRPIEEIGDGSLSSLKLNPEP